MSVWYLINNGQQSGPHPDATIIAWIRAGQLREAQIAQPNSTQWLNLRDYPPFAEHLRAMEVPPPGYAPTYVAQPYANPYGGLAARQPKERKTGFIVALALLGTCGVCSIAVNGDRKPGTRVEVVESSAPAAVDADQWAPAPLDSTQPPDTLPSPALSSPALPSPDLPPFGKGVIVDFEILDTDTRLPLVAGVTNLPNGTDLMVSIESKRGFKGSAKAKVVDGRFSAGPFGPAGGLSDGLYTAEIMTPIAAVQPAEVLAILGKKGKNLKGKVVHEEGGEKSVEAHADFHIGRDAKSAAQADQAQAASSRQTAKAVYDEAMALVELGIGSFNPLRRRSDMAAANRCGALMHGAGSSVERAKAVRALADGLPNDPYFDLKVATIELQFCVTCSGWGAEDCQMAKSSLREAKKIIR